MISSDQINEVRALAKSKYPDCNSLTLNKLGCPDNSCSQHATYAATILNKQGEVIELAFSDQSEEDAIANLAIKLKRK